MKISASRLLVAAVVAGVAGDLLLRGGNQWRIGFAIWIAGMVASVLLLDRNGSRERNLMLVGIVAAAFGLVVRDSPLLYAIDFLSLLSMGMLIIWHGSGRVLADLSLVETVRVGILAAGNTLGGAIGALSRNASERANNGADTGRTRALLIGAVLAIPPLAVVTALLASDQVFEGLLQHVANLNSVGHLFVIVLVAWFSAGWLRAATGDALGSSLPAPQSPALRFATIAVPLYSLVTLLTLFLATQARVLFGGAEFLRQTEGLTVATYARDGFAQLIVAAGVVLATLIVAEWLLDSEDASARRHYRIVGAILLGLVTTLLVSAAARIGIYVQMFGHSVDRLFASAAIVWVLAALVTCAMTTLRAHPARFASTTVGVTIAWVVLLNLVNPESLVVRLNIARAVAGASFDAKYHAELSADAAPTLVSRAAQLPSAECQAVHSALQQTWTARRTPSATSAPDWRGRSIPLVRVERWYAAGANVPCDAQR